MTQQTVNAARIWVSGAEHNDFGRNSPSDGNITIGTTHVRTGTYAYRINAASATNSSWTLNNNDTKTNVFSAFLRFYVYITTLPASTRSWWSYAPGALGVTNPALRLRSTGVLEFHDGTTLIAAGSQALVTGQFYRIEIGVNNTDDLVSLRINGQTDIDWTATTGTLAAFGSTAIGALDTVAATFDMWIDDIAIDRVSWCGPGKVKRLAITGAGSATEAGFTIGGSSPAATKYQSINELVSDDGVTFVKTDTTSGHFELYALDDIPGDCVQARGIQYRMRFKRDGATNGSVNVATKLYNRTNDIGAITSTSVYQTAEWNDTQAANLHSTPVGGQWTNARVNGLEIGIKTNSANATDVSLLAAELDYDDPAYSLVSIQRLFADGWESGDAAAAGTVTGTAAAATNAVRSGTYSLRVNPAGSTASHVRTDVTADGQRREGFISCYIYVNARPTSTSKMRLFQFTSTTSLNGAVLMDSAGKIQVEDRSGAVGSLSGSAIPLTTWTRLDFRIVCSATTSSNDGILDVMVNGVSYSSSTTANSNNASYTHANFGTTLAPGTGGCDVNYDDCIIDSTNWVDPVDNIIVIDLLPTAAGALSGSAFTAQGQSNQWDCLDETPTNGDTDYVTTGTTTTTGSYVTSNLPGTAGAVRSVTAVASVKRDGASNGVLNAVIRTNSHTADPPSAVSSTSAYVWQRSPYSASNYDGAWTASLVNGSEVAIRNANANVSRCSNLRMTVEYVVETLIAYAQTIWVG